MRMIRQPIICVMGHVDHGKTSLLDRIRSSATASREAGGITQHIGASEVPISVIEEVAGNVLKKFGGKITIPGLLFIDTPGHAAFTNLRKRGGSVADLAILVVDISKNFEPQTYEAMEILKGYKTPFILAANKIDLMTGWRAQKTNSFTESLEKQDQNVAEALDAKIYELIGKLSELGFSSERFDRVKDFRKEVVIIPVSAKTGEGIAELMAFTAGIAQRFLEMRLNIDVDGPGKGSVLEKKEEKGLGTTIDVILYNGTLKVNDTVAFGSETGIVKAKIRALLKPKPLQEMREASSKFYYVDSVAAASGVKISGVGFDQALPGSLLISTDSKDYEKEIATEIHDVFATEKEGIILKADTIGTLEALSRLLSNENIKISKKGIGAVVKRDVLDAFSMRAIDPYNAVVLAFGVPIEDDAKSEGEAANVRIISENIIYKIIDDYKEWLEDTKKKERDAAARSITFPCMVKVLPNTAFRISHPAIFGVDVLSGKLKSSVLLMDEHGNVVGRVKEMQNNGNSVSEVKKGESSAISMDGVTFGRQLKDNDIMYAHINDEEEQLLRAKFSYMMNDEEQVYNASLDSTNQMQTLYLEGL
jgi:translation initiation factor 5B